MKESSAKACTTGWPLEERGNLTISTPIVRFDNMTNKGCVTMTNNKGWSGYLILLVWCPKFVEN